MPSCGLIEGPADLASCAGRAPAIHFIGHWRRHMTVLTWRGAAAQLHLLSLFPPPSWGPQKLQETEPPLPDPPPLIPESSFLPVQVFLHITGTKIATYFT
uniref:Uncharacterized protein n=1 Tax=Dunaliella tertiolecta TaxID=3047 RepID=A0A7S3VRD2_DUNTE